MRTKATLLAMLLAACGDDGPGGQLDGGEPCRYEESPLAATDLTPYGGLLADDIARLEIPRQGIWVWSASIDELDIDVDETELPAEVRFEHDPNSLRLSEHVSGGDGVACHGAQVLVDGMLTFTATETDTVIVSVPVTAIQEFTAGEEYGASEAYSPISTFSAVLHATVEYETMQISARVNWVDDERLFARFDYYAQSMTGPSSGVGVNAFIASFEP